MSATETYLRWSPGVPHPFIAMHRVELETAIADLTRKLAIAEAETAELK